MVREDPLPFMQQLPLFKGFSQTEVEVLSTVLTVRRLAPGENVCVENDARASLVIVVAGSVESFKQLRNDRRLNLGASGAGAIVGQKSLIDGRKQLATIAATSPTIVLECNRADFLRLFKADSAFAYKVLDIVVTDLSRRLRGVDKILDKMLSDPGKTLSSVLDALAEAGGLMGDGEEEPGGKKYYVDI